jgi:hypothetical protein
MSKNESWLLSRSLLSRKQLKYLYNKGREPKKSLQGCTLRKSSLSTCSLLVVHIGPSSLSGGYTRAGLASTLGLVVFTLAIRKAESTSM